MSGLAPPKQVLAEARALARLTHPNMLTVYETGVHDGVPFIVSELVRGGSRRAWIAAEPRSLQQVGFFPTVEVDLDAWAERLRGSSPTR